MATRAERWQVLPAAAFARVSEQWQALNDHVGPSSLWHPDFVIPLIEHFGSGDELVTVYGAPESPRAMAIMTRGGRLSWQTFQPSQAPIGLWMAHPDSNHPRLLDGLMKALPGMPVILGITQQDPLFTPRPQDTNRLSCLDYIRTANVTIRGTFDQYWGTRGKNLRRNMRRDRSRLERDGIKATLELVTDPTQVEQAIADYGALETAGWKAKGGTAIAKDNVQGRYYRDMLERFCRRGAGRIYRYRFNERVVAMDLCVVDRGTMIVLKTAYDEALDHISPGMLMREDEFRQVFDERQVTRIEFYGRVLEWHTRWTDEIRTLYHVNYYRWPLIRTLHTMRSSSQTDAPNTQGDKRSETLAQ